MVANTVGDGRVVLLSVEPALQEMLGELLDVKGVAVRRRGYGVDQRLGDGRTSQRGYEVCEV